MIRLDSKVTGNVTLGRTKLAYVMYISSSYYVKEKIMYLSINNFVINERIDDLYLALLTQLPFSTGDLKDVKKGAFSHFWIWNILLMSKCYRQI